MTRGDFQNEKCVSADVKTISASALADVLEKVLRRTNDEERRNIPGNQLFERPSGHATEGHCR